MGKTNQPADLVDQIRDLRRQVAELRRGQATTNVVSTTSESYLRGINLSGLEFAPNVVPGVVGTNYFAPAAADYAYFRGQGLTVVRLPFTWDRAQPFLNGALDETYMGLVDQGVASAAANSMKTVLDLHSYGRRYVPYPGGFTNDFSTAVGTWSGGTRSSGQYISDQNTFFSTMSGGDSRNPVAPASGYVLTLDAYITAEQTGAGNFPLLWVRVFDNNQPSATATYYQFTLSRFDQKFKWSKTVNGTVTTIGEVAGTINLNTLYTVVIDVNQGTPGSVVVTVNGSTVATFAHDPALTGGRINVVTSFTKAAIDNVTLDVGGDTTGATASGIYRIGDSQIPITAYADVWGRLAARYASNSNVWAYDLMNEPHDMPVPTTPDTYATTATVTQMYQAAITAIRAQDMTHWLILNLDQFSGFQAFTTQYGATPVQWWTDPAGKSMVGGHYYQDSDHSGSYQTPWSQTLRDRIPSEVTPLLAWAATAGVPVFAGEYGVPFRTGTDADNWRADLGTVMSLLDTYQAHGTYWAAGSHYTASTSVEPRTNGVVDYSATAAQMPTVVAHLGGKVTTTTVGTGGTGLTGAGPAGNVLTSDGTSWVSRPGPTGIWLPADHGYTAWAFDPAVAVNSSPATSGLLYLIRIRLSAPTTINSLVVFVATAGTGLVAGQCLAGLYSVDGTLLASTPDQSAAWATTGEKVMPLTVPGSAAVPYAASAAAVYVALLSNGTTGPAFSRGASAGSQAGNAGLPISRYRFGQTGSGQTALPATVTMTALNNGTGYWAALS